MTEQRDPGNLSLDILDRLSEHHDAVALGRQVDGYWQDVTLGAFHGQVVALAKGLLAAGVATGDRVVILSKTRYEWTVADYAIWWIGATTVPVYETSSVAQVEWILEDSGAVAAIVETEAHQATVDEARPKHLKHVWCIDTGALDEITSGGVGVSDTDVEARRAVLFI